MRAALVAPVVCWLHAVPGFAQQTRTPAARRFEISAGSGWVGSSTLVSRDATLTAVSGARFRLFSTASTLEAGPEFHVRLGARLTPTMALEIGASFSRPSIETSVTADAENAPATVASVGLNQLTIEGDVRLSPQAWRAGSRAQLFVVAGGGVFRQLDDSRTLAESGRVVYAGGGVTVPLTRQSGAARSTHVGLRVDLRAMACSGGMSFDETTRVSPAVTASIFTTF